MARWMKWAIPVAGIVVLIPVFTGIWYWRWERQAQRALDEQVEQIRASGAPLYVSDLIPAEIPDEENAALSLRAAAAVLEADGSRGAGRAALELLQISGVRPPLRENEVAAIRGILDRNEEVWSHLEEAVRREKVRWPIEYSSPMMLMLLPDLNEQRMVAQFVQWAAYLAHHEGDDALALQRLGYLPFVGEAVDQMPMILSHLVSIGVWGLYCEAIDQVAPELRIVESGTGGSASSAEVRRMIALLLDDELLRSGTRRAFEIERVSSLDAYERILDGSFAVDTRPIRRLQRPMVLSNAGLTAKYLSQLLETFEVSARWPAFERDLPQEVPKMVEENDRYELTAMLLPSYRRLVETHYRILTDRRLAACALAVRLYAAEHEGRLPASLEALVPGYLPAVPLDPMDPDGGAIRYRPEGEAPVVYSVGENGVDDGGSSDTIGRWARPGVSRWSMLDAVVHLARQSRPEEEEWNLDELFELD